jgi:hypothetical protein
MDHIFVRFGIPLSVLDVPSEGGKERIQELLAELCFIVSGREVLLAIAIEPFNELFDFGWGGHGHLSRTRKTKWVNWKEQNDSGI